MPLPSCPRRSGQQVDTIANLRKEISALTNRLDKLELTTACVRAKLGKLDVRDHQPEDIGTGEPSAEDFRKVTQCHGCTVAGARCAITSRTPFAKLDENLLCHHHRDQECGPETRKTGQDLSVKALRSLAGMKGLKVVRLDCTPELIELFCDCLCLSREIYSTSDNDEVPGLLATYSRG